MTNPYSFIKKILVRFTPLKEFFLLNKWSLLGGLFSLLVVDFLQLLIPLVIKKAVDHLTTPQPLGAVLLRYSLLIVAMAAGIALFRYAWRYLIFGHSRKVEEGLRNMLYEHLQSLPHHFYQRIRTGDLMARAINDINAIRMATGMGLVALTDGIILGVAAIGFMFAINPLLAVISLLPSPVVILLTRYLTRRMSFQFEEVQASFSHLTERVREAFAGIKVIKAYCREEWQYGRVQKESSGYVDVNMRLARTLALFYPMMALFTNVGLAIVIWMGGRLAIVGTITTGEFVAFTSYLGLLTWPMMAMGWVANLLQRASASMDRINQILQEPPAIPGPFPAKGPEKIHGLIEIKGLSLVREGAKRPVLKEIELRVKPGQTLAIVGRVGSGKSTLLQTIPRIIEPPRGTVFVDSIDIHNLPITTLRSNIGFVSQEVTLFSDTVKNNIVFGREDLGEADIIRALEMASLIQEVGALDQGMETHVGERGVTLSGGQRQRLTLARALITNPPILILDDPFSMVDTETEKKILDRILAARDQMTTIIVSHRISTLIRAHWIVVLDEGRIVEQGTHEQLLRQGTIYSELYERQLIESELDELVYPQRAGAN